MSEHNESAERMAQDAEHRCEEANDKKYADSMSDELSMAAIEYCIVACDQSALYPNTVNQARAELAALLQRIESLEKENAALRTQLSQSQEREREAEQRGNKDDIDL